MEPQVPALQPLVGSKEPRQDASTAAKAGLVHHHVTSMAARVQPRSYFNPVPFLQMLHCLGGKGQRAVSTPNWSASFPDSPAHAKGRQQPPSQATSSAVTMMVQHAPSSKSPSPQPCRLFSHVSTETGNVCHNHLGSLRRPGLFPSFRLQCLGSRLVLLVRWLLQGPLQLLPSDGDPGWPRLALGSRPCC